MPLKIDDILSKIKTPLSHQNFLETCIGLHDDIDKLDSLRDRNSVIKHIIAREKEFWDKHHQDETESGIKVDNKQLLEDSEKLFTLLNGMTLGASVHKKLQEAQQVIHSILEQKESLDEFVEPIAELNELVELVPTVLLDGSEPPPLDGVVETPSSLDFMKDAYEVVGHAIEFFTFPLTCLLYKIREKRASFAETTPAPTPPWQSKYGWTKFILSLGALVLGIIALSLPGVGPVLAIATAGVSLGKALLEIAKTLYKVHQEKKALAHIENELAIIKGSNPEEEARLIKQVENLKGNIKSLSLRKQYISISEKTIGTGIAILGLAGTILALANPFTGPLVGAVALGCGIIFGLYKIAKWGKQTYANHKVQQLTNELLTLEQEEQETQRKQVNDRNDLAKSTEKEYHTEDVKNGDTETAVLLKKSYEKFLEADIERSIMKLHTISIKKDDIQKRLGQLKTINPVHSAQEVLVHAKTNHDKLLHEEAAKAKKEPKLSLADRLNAPALQALNEKAPKPDSEKQILPSLSDSPHSHDPFLQAHEHTLATKEQYQPEKKHQPNMADAINKIEDEGEGEGEGEGKNESPPPAV